MSFILIPASTGEAGIGRSEDRQSAEQMIRTAREWGSENQGNNDMDVYLVDWPNHFEGLL